MNRQLLSRLPAGAFYAAASTTSKFRVATLFVAALSSTLLLPAPAGAQTCNSTCNDTCGPVQDVGKAVYQRCMATCVAKCSKCTSTVGTLFPKYYVLGLVYAPPGCTSTSTAKCGSQSSVDYQDASTLGTKVSSESSFATNVDLKIDFGFGDPKATKFGVSASGGFTVTDSDSSSQTITKGTTQDIKAQGNGDGVNHNEDTFIVLVDPAIGVQQNHQFTGEVCNASKNVGYYVGVSDPQGFQERVTLRVEDLKNPANMNPDVAQQLKNLNFTPADFQTILSLDPYANGSPAIDANRYIPTTYSFPYEPPTVSQDCNGGVCSCLAISQTIKNEFATESGATTKTEYKVGLSESVSGIDLGIFEFGASSNQNFTWTSSSTTSNTTSDSQSASVTVSCPSVNYNGPIFMDVYWDKLFGSFLFVPRVLGPQTSILSKGTVVGTTGQPLRHEAIDLTIAGKTYHTITDRQGKYTFASATGAAQSGTGLLVVKGVRQAVTLGARQEVTVRVPTNTSLK